MFSPLLGVIMVSIVGHVAAQSCLQDGSSYSYTESVDSSTRTITFNGCPNHPDYNLNPNYAIETSTTYNMPAYPKYVGAGATQSPTTGDDTATTDLSEQGGGVGVFFNGAFLYSPYGGTTYGQTTSFATSATYAEGNTFDQCGCHSSSTTSASYHCHVPPSCLLQQLGAADSTHSPQIGWALDGFPLYGPRGSNGTLMQTCTVTGGTYGTDQCTDDCGGYYKEDSSIDDFVYRYHVQGTYNDGLQSTGPSCPSPGEEYYPNTPMCLRGCCAGGASCTRIGGTSLPQCSSYSSSDRSDGYTSSYSPSVVASSGSSATTGTNMSAGLSQNTDAVACQQLGCETSTCSDQSWSDQRCGAGQSSSWTNTCPDTSSPTATPTTGSPSSAPTDAPTSAPTASPTASPTPAPPDVSQTVVFAYNTSQWAGDLQTFWEKSYGQALGLYSVNDTAYEAGCTVDSSVSTSRRSSVSIVFVASTTAALFDSANASASALDASSYESAAEVVLAAENSTYSSVVGTTVSSGTVTSISTATTETPSPTVAPTDAPTTSPTPAPTEYEADSGGSLDTGAVMGIVVGVTIGGIVVVALLCYACVKYAAADTKKSHENNVVGTGLEMASGIKSSD